MSSSKQYEFADLQATYNLTDHEAAALLNKGAREFEQSLGKLRREHEGVSREIEWLREELIAALDDHGRTDQSKTSNSETPASKDKRLAGQNWKSLAGIVSAKTGTALGIMLIGGAAAVAAIDWAMFYQLFKSSFEGIYGEMSSTDKFLAGLFSTQAIGAMLAIKAYATSPERRAKIAAISVAGAMAFTVGAALERAEAHLEEKQEYAGSDAGLTWGEPESSDTAAGDGLSAGATLSAYLMSSAFITLPCVGALMVSAGWSSFTVSRRRLTTARGNRRNYRKLGLLTDRLSALEDQIASLVGQKASFVRRSLDERVMSIVEGLRTQKEAVKTYRQNGLSDVIRPKSPEDRSVRYTDLDTLEEDINASLKKFSNGFCDEIFSQWSAEKSAAP